MRHGRPGRGVSATAGGPLCGTLAGEGGRNTRGVGHSSGKRDACTVPLLAAHVARVRRRRATAARSTRGHHPIVRRQARAALNSHGKEFPRSEGERPVFALRMVGESPTRLRGGPSRFRFAALRENWESPRRQLPCRGFQSHDDGNSAARAETRPLRALGRRSRTAVVHLRTVLRDDFEVSRSGGPISRFLWAGWHAE